MASRVQLRPVLTDDTGANLGPVQSDTELALAPAGVIQRVAPPPGTADAPVPGFARVLTLSGRRVYTLAGSRVMVPESYANA